MIFEWVSDVHRIDVDFETMYDNAMEDADTWASEDAMTIQGAVRDYLSGLDSYDFYALNEEVVGHIEHEFRIWLRDHDLSLPEEED